MTAEERETVIQYDDASAIAGIYSVNSHVIRCLDALCQEHPESYVKLREGEYQCPKRLIAFRRPRHMTPESHALAVARGKALYQRRCALKNNTNSKENN